MTFNAMLLILAVAPGLFLLKLLVDRYDGR